MLFSPINSNFYKKKNLYKTNPHNGLENDISRLRNHGNILLIGDFNARTSNNQAIILSNHSNPNPLWLDEDPTLASRYKRSSEDLGENLFGSELVKLCSAQDLIICNGLKKWPNSNKMTCIHGLGSSVVDYVISDLPLYNEIINFDILNDHEPDSDHRPLLITLNFVMHRDPIENNPYIQKNLIFDRNKNDLFLNELKTNLLPLSSIDNIEDLYHNFTTTHSYSINNFSIEVTSNNKRNRKTNPWYDKYCKSARREIKEVVDESLKMDKIKIYKALIKRKKRQYIC